MAPDLEWINRRAEAQWTRIPPDKSPDRSKAPAVPKEPVGGSPEARLSDGTG